MGAKVTEQTSVSITPQYYDFDTPSDAVKATDVPSIVAFTPDAPLSVAPDPDSILVSEDVALHLPMMLADPADAVKTSEELEIVLSVAIESSDAVSLVDLSSVVGPKSLPLVTDTCKKITESVTLRVNPTGYCDVTFPKFSVSVVGAWGGAASVEVELLPLAIEPETGSVGLYGASGTVDVNLPVLTVDAGASGVIDLFGDGLAEIPAFSIDSYGYAGEVGTAAVTFPALSGSATGNVSGIDGTTSLELPLFIVDASGEVAQALDLGGNVAMFAANIGSFGVTEHYGMGATGVCFHDGLTYIANANGIWACDAEADDGEPIPVMLTREGIGFGISQVKALTDAYSLVRSTSGYSLRVTARDSGGTGSTSTVKSNPHGSKVSLPRGLRSRLFDLTLYADADNELEVDEVELVAEVSQGRRGRQNG